MIRSPSDTAAPRGPIDNNLRIGDIVTLKYLKRQVGIYSIGCNLIYIFKNILNYLCRDT
jgi:hypothetical protein